MSACDPARSLQNATLVALSLALWACADGPAGSPRSTSVLDSPVATSAATDKRSPRDAQDARGVEIVGYSFAGELCPEAQGTAEITRGRVFDLFVAGEPLVAHDSARVASCELTLELRVAPGLRVRGPSVQYQLDSIASAEWETSRGFDDGTASELKREHYDDAGAFALEEPQSDAWSPRCADEPERVHYRIRMTSIAQPSAHGSSLQLTQLSADFGLEQARGLEPCAASDAHSGREGAPLKGQIERDARRTPL